MNSYDNPSPFWEIAGIAVGLIIVIRAILYFIEYK